MPPNEWAAVDAVIDRHLAEHYPQLLRHFAQYCIDKGLTKPSPYPSHMEKKHTWQERGRRMYRAAPFDRAVQELLDAKKRVPRLRGDKGQDAQRGQAPGRSEDERSAYHEFQGWSGAAEPPEDSPQAGLDFSY